MSENTAMQSCLFCRIIKREIPSQIVYEDDSVLAFKDIRPEAPVHLLVCPRKHIPTLNDISPEDNPLIGQMFQAAKTLAEQSGIQQDGWRTVFNVNAGAGQTVFHIHLHLLGGRQFHWPPG
jgi:histidine triad (HIT) family protein